MDNNTYRYDDPNNYNYGDLSKAMQDMLTNAYFQQINQQMQGLAGMAQSQYHNQWAQLQNANVWVGNGNSEPAPPKVDPSDWFREQVEKAARGELLEDRT